MGDWWGSGRAKIEQQQFETVTEKTYRKFYNEPYVPVGALVTVGFLTFGFRAFRTGDKRGAQLMMRWRVVAQAFTVGAMCVGAYLNLKPTDRPKVYEEVLKTLSPQLYVDKLAAVEKRAEKPDNK